MTNTLTLFRLAEKNHGLCKYFFSSYLLTQFSHVNKDMGDIFFPCFFFLFWLKEVSSCSVNNLMATEQKNERDLKHNETVMCNMNTYLTWCCSNRVQIAWQIQRLCMRMIATSHAYSNCWFCAGILDCENKIFCSQPTQFE